MRPSPGVYPRESVRPTTSVAERAVWKALRDRLPSGWYAWHSLRLRDRRATFGEGDFVLAHPDRGILLLEVKGGAIELRDGNWLQNGRPLPKAPLDQAHGFRGLLLSRLRAAGVDAPSIGQAPCFPDTDFDGQPTADDLAGIVMGAHHLRWLAESLPAIASRAIPPPRTSRGDWLAALHAMWGETWVPSLSLGTRAREQAERRLALDEAQLEVMEGLVDNDRVLVQGGAGSGKTLVAAEAARRLAASGARVLLLCFTAPLRKWLAVRLDGARVEVHTVSGLAKRIADAAGGPPPPQDLPDAEAWGAVFERAASAAGLPAFDAVVVDEAQDLQREAWRLVAALARGRRLWAFHDPGQGFWSDRTPPPELFGMRYRLPRQLRCPAGVQALANRILGQPFDAAEIARAREDGTIVVVPADGADAAAAAVEAAVRGLLEGGLSARDVGIVSLRGRAARSGEAVERIAGHDAVAADAPEMEERLVADTFLRWKGLERPGIVVTGLAEENLNQLPIRLNVALTRATVAVRIVGTAAALTRLGLS